MLEQQSLISNESLPGEQEEIQKLLKLMAFFHEKQHQAYQKYFRDQHAQSTGCVQAKFIVNEDIPNWAKVGIFKEPGKTYDAIARFSNSSSNPYADQKQDRTARGMAIKLLGIEGKHVLDSETLKGTNSETDQDFLMTNYPVFAFPDVRSYREFFELLQRCDKLPFGLSQLLPRLIYFKILHPQLGEIAEASIKNYQEITNPLDIQYWSMSPYRLGTQAIKFSAQPILSNQNKQDSGVTNNTQESRLLVALKERLSQEDVSFNFLIQPRLEAQAQEMPIENISKAWPEIDIENNDPTKPHSSHYFSIAKLVIPQQEPSTCENRIFSPWHALAEHEPLGGINRLRKQVYPASANRRQANNVS